jgi:hypothetical protein
MSIWMLASRPGLLVLQWISMRRKSDRASHAMPYVQGLEGPYAGKRLPLDSDLVFGRDPKSCNVVFSRDEDGISARHCSLRFLPLKNSFELRDLGSANGSFVDGKRVDPSYAVLLRDGEEFYLFRSRYRFAVHLGASLERA